MRIGLIGIMMLILVGSVSATTFTENTTFSEGNINYVFIEGLEIDRFEILPGGIKVDDAKIGLTLQGGELTVRFHKFDVFDKRISIQSSVPQEIQFQVTDDGKKQYLYDERSYHLNDYRFDDTEEVFFDFVVFDDQDQGVVDVDVKSIEKLKWYEQKVFEFETSTTMSKSGIITGETFSITYLWLTIILIAIIVGMMVWWAFK